MLFMYKFLCIFGSNEQKKKNLFSQNVQPLLSSFSHLGRKVHNSNGYKSKVEEPGPCRQYTTFMH